MPHIMVKLYPGHPEQQKAELAEKITQDVITALNSHRDSVSVSIEEVSPTDWPEKIYRQEIIKKSALLYKKPGYKM